MTHAASSGVRSDLPGVRDAAGRDSFLAQGGPDDDLGAERGDREHRAPALVATKVVQARCAWAGWRP